ncbi:unnamed protein product, partial [Brugia timori]|uniref:Uncharacterized protein n=1 Tax=Brugia timori TaxID=42155 RepID=A0A0R3QZ83_9BILA
MLKAAILLMLHSTYAKVQNYETGDNSTVKGCSSHCSFHDGNLTCLNGSLEFYERLLLAQMKHFVAVQMHIGYNFQIFCNISKKYSLMIKSGIRKPGGVHMRDEKVLNKTYLITRRY